MYSDSEILKIIKNGISSLDLNKKPSGLYAPIEYIISVGGKRIRPRLALLTYNLFCSNIDEKIIYPALALEIFHAYTLVHDDIMDKSDRRRGQLTIHKKWNENTAILSGDVMSILAYKYLAYVPEERLSDVYSLFTDTAIKVCEGQQYDMDFEKDPAITMEEYKDMIGKKTAVLIACAAKLGAIIAGVEDKVAQALYIFGYQLGMAFQITDDYLDVYADPNFFGKNVGEDIVDNKKSWMQVETLRYTEESDKKRLFEIMSMSRDEAEAKILAMKEMYAKIGIKEHAEKEIKKYYISAMKSVEDIGLDEEKINRLKNFAEMLITRKN